MFVVSESVGLVLALTCPAFIRDIHRQQLFNLVAIFHIQGGSCPQDPGQILVRIQPVLLSGLDQAEVNGAGIRSTGRVGKQEVLPGHYKGFNAAFAWLCEYSDNHAYPNKSLIRSFLHQSL